MSGVAVKPQLSAVDPVNVEKVKLGSMKSVCDFGI